MSYFFAALHFLTSFPYPGRRFFVLEDVVKGLAFFPLIGFLIGLALYGLAFVLDMAFPIIISRALLLAGWVAITGALHLDGLADTLDGLGGGSDRETRLSIMRDSRIGTCGMVGIVLYLLIKFTALYSIPSYHLLPVLVIAPLISRLSMVLLLIYTPYARIEGLGRLFIEKSGKTQGIIATGITVCIALLFIGWHFLIYFIMLIALIATLRKYFLSVLGGITGDIVGAVNELVEICILLLFLILLKLL